MFSSVASIHWRWYLNPSIWRGLFHTFCHVQKKRIGQDIHKPKVLSLDDLPWSFADDKLSSFPVAMVTSVLRAMKNGASEARHMFPRLLQLAEKYPADVIAPFIKKVRIGLISYLYLFMPWTQTYLTVTHIFSYPELGHIWLLLIFIHTLNSDIFDCYSYLFILWTQAHLTITQRGNVAWEACLELQWTVTAWNRTPDPLIKVTGLMPLPTGPSAPIDREDWYEHIWIERKGLGVM